MSNVELIKNLYQAFAQGDVPTVMQAFDSKIEWTDAEGFPTGGTYQGPQAVLQSVFMPLITDWDDFRVAANDFLDAGERIVALGNYSGSYKTTGKSMTAPFAHVWTIKNNKVIKFVQFTDTLVVARAL
jgi:ketosteroid isomerase-like protein